MNCVWNQYPRPQMRRKSFQSLNGEWILNGKKIMVPFPPQSKLSEYAGEIKDNLIYEKRFVVPVVEKNSRLLLHFDAVDQRAKISLNGQVIGMHEGGYLPFEFDVTEYVRENEENHLLVEVEDSLSFIYPYGKQCKKRGGMWYTPVSGIWKNVWLECVPRDYIRLLKLTPDLQGVDVELVGDVNGFYTRIELAEGKVLEHSFEGKRGRIDLSKEKGLVYWECDNPHLYNMTITAGEDCVETYFALRTVEIKGVCGVARVCLNGKPVFLHGVLDQGYFQDGIFLPHEEREYERDVLRMKELGFNMLRKHIKVEPECFYYYCDKHGMLVVQDMVNSGTYSFIRDTALPTFGFDKKNDVKMGFGVNKNEELARRAFFETHMKEILQVLYNHPCIVAYTIFNEGWGQFESDRMYDVAKEVDGTRLFDSTSGWFAQRKSDFDSKHVYFRTVKLSVKERPLFLSECGGYTYAVKGHLFDEKKSYGYGKCTNSTELTEKIISMYEKMVVPAIQEGLCGCVYTQLSDVEEEINGLYTYDRKVCKVEKIKLQKLVSKLSI